MGKTAARRAVRFKNDAATMRGSVTGAKTVADTVNSDAVSERSAKRVPLRAVFLQCQDGQRGSGIDSAVASRIRHRIAPRLGTEISAAVWLCDELPYASHEILARSAF